MRIIKGVLFVFAGLFVLVTLISLLIPSQVIVTRATPIQGDSLKIFDEVSDLKKWKNWHPVFKNDSVKIFYSNITNEINSSAQWITKGKTNKLVITEKKYPVVKIELHREGENTIDNYLALMPVQEQGNMQVQWTSVTRLHWYPWEKFGGIFIEQMTGSGYETALKNLKQFIESNKL